MKLCFIVDARSPIARNWINYFVEQGHEVHIISSYPCDSTSLPATSLHVVPLAFSALGRSRASPTSGTPRHDSENRAISPKRDQGLVNLLPCLLRSSAVSQWVTPLWGLLASIDIYRHTGKIRQLIDGIRPDLVHAMRIPFEGIAAAQADPQAPLVTSVWGNDFTLFARYYPWLGLLTRQAMQRTDVLHCDCNRDLVLAYSWSFDKDKLSFVLPGAGGVQVDTFYPGRANDVLANSLNIAPGTSVVINPRGFRPYILNDIFFKAIPIVLSEQPQTIFLCSAMQGSVVAKRWMERLNIGHAVRLLPVVPREQMANLFRLSQITISPSIHDGTPNTLLEAMGCGCFPVAGNIESVHEWITDGINGLLYDPSSPEELAAAILRALKDSGLRQQACAHNLQLISDRAEYGQVMAQAEQFYQQAIERASYNVRQG